MLYIDFWFEDLNGQLVVVGWSQVPGIVPQLAGQTPYDATPRLVDRYARADLGTQAALAFVAIFGRSLSASAGHAGDLTLEANGHGVALPAPGRGLQALAETGVKEAYERVLLLMAAGHIAMVPDAACAAVIKRRMGDYPSGKVEASEFGLAVDQGVVSADGTGLLYGWFLMNRRYSTAKLYGFRLTGAGISRLRIFEGQIDRADLAGYKTQYSFTGRDGFAAATLEAVPEGAAGDTQLYLVVDLGATTAIVQAPTQAGSTELVGQAFAFTHHALKRSDHRRELTDGFLGRLKAGSFDDLAPGFATFGEGPAVMIVDVDLHGQFVSDLCLALYRQALALDRILLMVDQNDNAAFQSIDRIVAELAEFPGAVEIGFVDRGALGASLAAVQDEGFARVIFARASILFHMVDRAPDLLAQVVEAPSAEIVVFSTLAHQVGVAAAEARVGYQPLILSAPLPSVAAALGRMPDVLVTEEALFKYITARLPQAFIRRLAPDEGLMLGSDGKHNALLVSGQNAYNVDSLILSMMAKSGMSKSGSLP